MEPSGAFGLVNMRYVGRNEQSAPDVTEERCVLLPFEACAEDGDKMVSIDPS